MLDFGEALKVLRDGGAVTRTPWPRGKSLILVPASRVVVSADRPLGKALPSLVDMDLANMRHIDLVTVSEWSGDVSLQAWSPSHADLLAEDWVVKN